MLSGSTLLRHLAQFYCAIYILDTESNRKDNENKSVLSSLTVFQERPQSSRFGVFRLLWAIKKGIVISLLS